MKKLTLRRIRAGFLSIWRLELIFFIIRLIEILSILQIEEVEAQKRNQLMIQKVLEQLKCLSKFEFLMLIESQFGIQGKAHEFQRENWFSFSRLRFTFIVVPNFHHD